MINRTLTDGSPVPADNSHTEINPTTGMQRGYVVLSAEERAKGFRKPFRDTYVHNVCGVVTIMGSSLAETYARDPWFYTGTYCVECKAHYPLDQFRWSDGEPMDPELQDAWHEEQARIKKNRETLAAIELERTERAEMWRLIKKYNITAVDHTAITEVRDGTEGVE